MNKTIKRAIIRKFEKITTNFYNLKFHVSNHQVNNPILLKIF